MSANDNGPDSGDDPRLEKIEPSLPRVNQDVEKEDADSGALHPSVYVDLDLAELKRHSVQQMDPRLARIPIPRASHSMASSLCDGNDADYGANNDAPRWTKERIVYSLSLICGNLTYLYLSVAFIQMLKATTPVAVLVTGWFFGVQKPNMRVLFNVSFIVIGVVLASFGEIKFVMLGFLFQCGGIMFEAVRLVMVQRLLNSPDSKMDPLVSLYYFAPVCTVFNGLIALAWEVPKVSMAEVHKVGLHNFALNAMVAFALNVSVVFLIGKTSSLVLTLCGVLKDILLVAASMMIWGTIVTPLQFIGYAIALGGLVYYKLGGEQVRTHLEMASQRWRSMSSRRPFLWRLLMFIIAFCIVYALVDVLAPSYAPKYGPERVSAAYLAAKERYRNGAADIPNDGRV
ncbi:hypothetical protein V493_07251 [Pseudogymnoascus sp. VKM F-4281 (FW-2241)]|nr:hypothetical protein V493_07251 [Pseudogymnoascus sp. VKM F-4281 (FW-2241)]